MYETGYNTIHEQYVGSGILKLSQLSENPYPDPYYRFDPHCVSELNRLKETFKHRTCKPWLPEHRLYAKVSIETWKSRKTVDSERLEDNIVYPWLLFEPDAAINIFRGIPFLMFARSTSDEQMWKTFATKDPDERWWVVDFFQDKLERAKGDQQDRKRTTLQSQHRAALAIIRAATSQLGTLVLPDASSLSPYLEKDILRVCRKTALITPMQPLLNIESLWITKSLTYFTYMRKSHCVEACHNYLDFMRSQWVDITLDWNTEVVQSLDPESIKKLQSRAPFSSRDDLEFVVELFESETFLPKLTSSINRRAVKEAVCRCRYPILTLQTFSDDVKLLTSRIDAPMRGFLGNGRQRNMSTLRERVQEHFRLVMASTAETGRQCVQYFELLFLQLMREPSPKSSISEACMNDLAKQVSQGDFDHDVDATKTRIHAVASRLQSDSNLEVQKRHGHNLFRDRAATQLLHHDMIRGPYPPLASITPEYMGGFIACVFLFGVPPLIEVDAASAGSNTKTADSAVSKIRRLPFDNDASSVRTYESRNESSSAITNVWGESMQELGDVRRKPRVEKNIIGLSSVSIVGSKHSLVHSDPSVESGEESPRFRHSTNVERWVAGRNRLSSSSAVSITTPNPRSEKDWLPMRGALSDRGSLSTPTRDPPTDDTDGRGYSSWSASHLPESEIPQDDQLTNMVSPSLYSHAEEHKVHEPVNMSLPHESRVLAREYTNHILQSGYGQDVSRQEISTEKANGSSSPDGGTLYASPWYTTRVAARPQQADVAETTHSARIEQSFVTFQSTRNEKLKLDAPKDERSIHGFVRTQMALRSDTKISYNAQGVMKDYTVDDDLYLEIVRYSVKVVFVDSDILASTDYRLPPLGTL